jgi:2-keto-3-deoxy-L-rhamnonate aldolase RhmA
MGFEAVGAITKPEVLDTIVRVHRTATAAGLVTGIHAGEGKTGCTMGRLGFRMVTLAAESQALRRGAAEYLREATAK